MLLIVGIAGLATLSGEREGRERSRTVVALGVSVGVAVALAWLASQASPAWATRYLAIAVAPLLLLGAVGLLNASRLGVAAFAVLLVSWTFAGSPGAKSNAHYVSVTFADSLRPGDMVVSTQPEQVPVLDYYLPPGMRYFSPFGPVSDPGVVDWRDGAAHFDRTNADHQLLPYLKRLHVGRHVMLVEPIIFFPDRWKAPWTKRVYDRTVEYDGLMRGDPRFRLIGTVPTNYRLPGPNPLLGLLFEKVRPD
jgi:mannosyltransferase